MSSGPTPNLITMSSAKAARGLGNLEAALLRAIDQAVIATDLDGTIIFWNRFAEELYGWKSEEVLGQNILEVTPTAQSRDAAAGA